MKTFGIIVLVVLLIPVFLAIILIGKGCGSAAGVLDRTIDPDNVIFTYEWFFNVNAEYRASLKKIETADAGLGDYLELNGAVGTWKRDQREEYARLKEIKRGLENFRDGLIEKYNAGTGKANRAIFKDGDLPSRLP